MRCLLLLLLLLDSSFSVWLHQELNVFPWDILGFSCFRLCMLCYYFCYNECLLVLLTVDYTWHYEKTKVSLEEIK